MLNYRRKSLLKRLLQSEPGTFISVDMLAEELAASEKTIRTDLKALDSWLIQYQGSRIIRKPGFGVCMEATTANREALYEWIKEKKQLWDIPQESLRKQMLLELLLQRESVVTTQKLAEKLYVSKPAIRHELKEVSNWLKDFRLTLVKKPNVGLLIEGKEKDWRAALAELFREMTLLRDVPGETIVSGRLISAQDLSLLESWIRDIQRLVGVDFTDASVENLVLHLAIAIQRIKNKKVIEISNEETRMIQEKPEFKWVQGLADRIRKTFMITLSSSEMVYIALHFMGAKQQSLRENDPEAFDLSIQLVREMERLISQPFGKDHELITGIAIHLHSALNRIRYGLQIKNPLLSQIKEMYRYPFEALLLAVPGIAVSLGLTFPEDEIGYLALHFQAALERLYRNFDKSVKALVVCSTGTGTSQLLSSRLARIFPNIHVVHVTSLFHLDEEIRAYKPDVVISTVPIANASIPCVTVSALFPESDRLKVEAFISGLSSAGRRYPTLYQLMIPELVFLDISFGDKFQVMDFLAEKLTESGFTDIGYGESVLSREQISSTVIGTGIAIPHGSSSHIRKSGMAIARLKQPIDWGGEDVKFVLMLAIMIENRSETEQLFREMAELVDDENVLNRLQTASTIAEFISFLEGKIT